MKVLSIAAKLVLTLLVGLPLLLLILSVDLEPAAMGTAELSDAQIADVQQLLINNDPKLLLERKKRTLRVSETEANALLAYFLRHIPEFEGMNGDVSLRPGKASVTLTTGLMRKPSPPYLNLELSVVEEEGVLAVRWINLGHLRLPRKVLYPLLDFSRPFLEEDQNYRLLVSLMDTVDSVDLEEDRLEVRLDWRLEDLSDIRQRAQQILVGEEERTRIWRYYARLAEITGLFPPQAGSANLSDFFQPLFTEAKWQVVAGADPVAENRALLIAMSAYVNEIALEELTGPPPEGEPVSPRRMAVRIGARVDLPQHIVTSAAIAASAGAGVADLLSIYKEVHDARYRTGFSFSDLTANQVGTMLGYLATQDAERAVRVQDFLSNSLDASDYMPSVENFDGITEQEFINQYQDRNSEHYRQRLEEINAAIAERPLFVALEAP